MHFFHPGVATGQTDFWLLCVIKGEERKDYAGLQTNTSHLHLQRGPQQVQTFQDPSLSEIRELLELFFLTKVCCLHVFSTHSFIQTFSDLQNRKQTAAVPTGQWLCAPRTVGVL